MELTNEEKCTYCREYGNLPCEECNKKLEEKKAMNKDKYFIDLSKLSDEQRKSLPQIFENAGQEIYFLAKPTLLSGKLDTYYPYLFFSLPSSNIWVFSHNKPDRTELTYPEFIKLFEGEEKYDGWIKIESEADLPKKGTDCHVFFKTRVQTIFNNIDDLEILTLLNRCSHYMPIIKPLPPRF